MASPGAIASALSRRNSVRIRKKEMKDLKLAFDAADTNHDDRLSQKELYIKLKTEGQNPSWNEVQKVIDKNDRDFDGQLCFNEFIGKETKIEMGFKALDINKDGYVTKEEFRTVCKTLSEDQIQVCFDRFDRNGDGKLDYREFCDMMNAHKRRQSLAHLSVICKK